MPDDTLITPVRTELPPATKIYPEIDLQQKTKEPSKFRQILGGVAGTALGIFAPGLGGILGRVIGGGGSSYGSYGALMQMQGQFEDMQRYSQLSNSIQAQHQNQMMNQQQQQGMQMLAMQQRVSMQSQEFATVSNLLKTRHDSEMTAVNNIKS